MRSALFFCGVALAAAVQAADEPAFRFTAPISVSAPGAFVQLPLPATAYGRSASTDLADLRIVDARGERVPFAVLAPRQPETQTTEQQRALPAARQTRGRRHVGSADRHHDRR
jgi:Protein of unknown function (DUF3999)